MPSREAVISAFEMLEAAGLKPPKGVQDNPEGAVTVYAIVLGDATDKEALIATVAYLRVGKFWPTAGELASHLPADEDARETQWGEGWALLEEVRRQHPGGTHAAMPARFSPDDDTDAAIKAGLETIGGWRAYGMLTHQSEATARAHFRDAYQTVYRSRRQARLARETTRLIEGGAIAGKLRLLEGGREDNQ